MVRPQFHQGFLGRGHMAAAVVDGSNYATTDPFIMLMDDRLDLPGGEPVGGPHPHAGFETVTLVLQGDGKDWRTGTLELMTAGSGIVHTEELTEPTHMHILQLWLALPPEKRWITPRWQQISGEAVPKVRLGESELAVYSGSSNDVVSPLMNHTPLTLVDMRLARNGRVEQGVPGGHSTFVYVLEGAVTVGDTRVQQGSVGWFDMQQAESGITFLAGEEGARAIFYAALQHHAPIVSHGPFIADTREDIPRLYHEYRGGKMPHLSTLPPGQRTTHGHVKQM